MNKAEIIKELKSIYDSMPYHEHKITELIDKIKQEPVTNRDKINNMSNEELFKKMKNIESKGLSLCKYCKYGKKRNCENKTCKDGVIEYLESEVKDD